MERPGKGNYSTYTDLSGIKKSLTRANFTEENKHTQERTSNLSASGLPTVPLEEEQAIPLSSKAQSLPTSSSATGGRTRLVSWAVYDERGSVSRGC